MKKLLCLMLFLFAGCGVAALDISVKNSGDEERARMCKERCKKTHYNITFIRASGKMEYYKINIVSIEDKVACECVF